MRGRRELPRQTRAFLRILAGAESARRADYLGRVSFYTSVFERLLTRRGVVGTRRYRGAAGIAIARSRGITGYDSRNILSVPIYGEIAPPPGLARSLAIQLI